jgi:hypothetical protein
MRIKCKIKKNKVVDKQILIEVFAGEIIVVCTDPEIGELTENEIITTEGRPAKVHCFNGAVGVMPQDGEDPKGMIYMSWEPIIDEDGSRVLDIIFRLNTREVIVVQDPDPQIGVACFSPTKNGQIFRATEMGIEIINEDFKPTRETEDICLATAIPPKMGATAGREPPSREEQDRRRRR